MKIANILASIRQNEKTAAEAPVSTESKTATVAETPRAALKAALDSAVEKVAAAPTVSPVDDVMKVASDLAAAEKEAALKEAELLGAAFADSVVARLSTWTKSAAEIAPASSVVTTGDAELDKLAAENPGLLEEAVANGYAPNRLGLEKMANDAYVQGYNDTVDAIHKTAAVEFLKGAAVTALILDQAKR
jgi:hypothetical protein